MEPSLLNRTPVRNILRLKATFPGLLFTFLGLIGLSKITAQSSPPSSTSPLQVLSSEAPNAVSWILSPLSKNLPQDIRQNLTFLKEDLVDEGTSKPVAQLDAYRSAFRLCTELIAAMDERDLTLVRAGYRNTQANNLPLITSQSLEARRNYLMSWPQYARELDERSAIEKRAITEADVAKERPKVEWAERTTVLRKKFDTLYSDFREALRKPFSKPTTTSQASPVAEPTPTSRPSSVVATTPSQPSPTVASITQSQPTAGPPTPATSGMPQQTNSPQKNKKPTSVDQTDTPNIVLSGATDSNENLLDANEVQIVNGLHIGNIHLPDRKSLTYFHLDTEIDNESPKGRIEKQLSVDVRVLCIDADGVLNVTKYSHRFSIGVKGVQQVGLGGEVVLDAIKLRNNNDEIPKNVYVALKINGKVFREVLLTNFGDPNWWKRDDLIESNK